MKKIYNGIIVFVILILISNFTFASEYWENKEDKKIKEACKSALDSYMKTFMTDETPEEDRITDYTYTGRGMSEGEDESKLYMSITMNIEPFNESNTSWCKSDICFVTFSKVNDEYVVDRISRYPDNYDEFLEKFEEYKNNNNEIEKEETTSIQGKSQNSFANQEIQKINSSLVITFAILFALSSMSLIIIVRRKMLKNK